MHVIDAKHEYPGYTSISKQAYKQDTYLPYNIG